MQRSLNKDFTEYLRKQLSKFLTELTKQHFENFKKECEDVPFSTVVYQIMNCQRYFQDFFPHFK
jgi:hypothetical protein